MNNQVLYYKLIIILGYLGDIMDDLGLSLPNKLASMRTLLKLPAKEFWSEASNHPYKLVTFVRQSRNLDVTKSE